MVTVHSIHALNPRRFPQRLVHARLPAGALGAEGGDYVLVEAERDLRLGRSRRAATADDALADAEFGASNISGVQSGASSGSTQLPSEFGLLASIAFPR